MAGGSGIERVDVWLECLREMPAVVVVGSLADG